MSDSTVTRHGRLILIPAVITLAVTLLRLAGELQDWSSILFNRSAGGGFAIIGIVWLVPVFGIYFALKLADQVGRPEKTGRGLVLLVLSVVLLFASGMAAQAAGIDPNGTTILVVFGVVAVAAVAVAWRAWPELARVLVGYGVAARIPVAIVMLIAILGDWGTHYDVPPTPEWPQMAPLAKWFWIGLLPQLTVWVAFTVIVGMLFGLIAVAIVHRGRGHRAS